MSRNQTAIMRKLLSETDKCELCGSKRSLEVHHIIPVSCGGPLDDADNMIVLCVGCHARLTPRRILANMKKEELRSWNVCCSIYDNFYSMCNKHFETIDLSADPCEGLDLGTTVFDIFDEVINNELIKIKIKNKEVSEQELKENRIDLIHQTKSPLINEKHDGNVEKNEQLEMSF